MDNSTPKYTKEQFTEVMADQIDCLYATRFQEADQPLIGFVSGCLQLAFVHDEGCGIPNDERAGCRSLVDALQVGLNEGFPTTGRMTQRQFLSYVKQQSTFGLYDNTDVQRQDPLLNLISLAHVTEMGDYDSGSRVSERTPQENRAIRSQLIEMLASFPEEAQ